MKYFKVFVAVLSVIPFIGYGQKPLLNLNQIGNYTVYNPAFAGSLKCPTFSVDYLYQRTTSNQPYQTIAASYSQHVEVLYGGLGVTTIYDSFDKNNQFLSVSGIYSYLIKVSRSWSIRAAVEASYNNKKTNLNSQLDRYDFINNTQYSSSLTLPFVSDINYFNTGLSMLVYSRNFYSGFTIDNILAPIEAQTESSEMHLPQSYSFISGGNILLGEDTYSTKNMISPLVAFRWQKGRMHLDSLQNDLIAPLKQLQLNVNFKTEKGLIGLGINHDFNQFTSYHGQVGINFNGLELIYNFGLSPYSLVEQGKRTVIFHQTSLTYQFLCKPKKRMFRTISCPSFGGGGSGFYRSSSSNKKTLSTSSNNGGNNIKSFDGNLEPGTLTASQINDFGKWELWKDIDKTELKNYQQVWKIIPRERFSVLVTNAQKRPITDSKVTLYNEQGEIIWESKTDNTGRAELWANLFDSNKEKPSYLIAENNGVKIKLDSIKSFDNGVNILTIDTDCSISNNLDILFVVDATGSMGDEIEHLKTELKDIILTTKQIDENLNLRLGAMFYRCEGNSYVTKKNSFSEDINNTLQFIKEQNADEGGTEAVEIALEEAIKDYSWSDNARARLMFLILDEAPGTEEKVIKRFGNAIKMASEKGIRIVPLVASGMGYNYDKSLEYLMRSVALATNGSYVFLTNHSGVGNDHTAPTTDAYDVELFNKLLPRLINQFVIATPCSEAFKYSEEQVKDTTVIEIIEHVVLTPVKDSIITPEIIKDSLFVTADTLEEAPKMIEEIKRFKYYPNPTQGMLTIELEGNIPELFLSDMYGKLIEKFVTNNLTRISVDISQYSDGLYLIQYISNGKTHSGKIILRQ